jgi:hypothetical protein
MACGGHALTVLPGVVYQAFVMPEETTIANGFGLLLIH